MITLCGRPNVGKSTLTNALVGEKVAIVSNKPQTTRNRITAIVNRGDTQFVLMDTPGFHKPRTRLGDYMVNVVKESVADVDCVLLLVEPVAAIGPQEEGLIERLKQSGARRSWSSTRSTPWTRQGFWRSWLSIPRPMTLTLFCLSPPRPGTDWRS
jgi:GTP-binding protein Era